MYPIFIIAFPQEFLNFNDNGDCNENGTKSSKVNMSSDLNITSHESAMACKLHCASERSCCGCSKVCSAGCKWNLVTNCEQMGNSNADNIQCLTRKPGNVKR